MYPRLIPPPWKPQCRTLLTASGFQFRSLISGTDYAVVDELNIQLTWKDKRKVLAWEGFYRPEGLCLNGGLRKIFYNSHPSTYFQIPRSWEIAPTDKSVEKGWIYSLTAPFNGGISKLIGTWSINRGLNHGRKNLPMEGSIVYSHQRVFLQEPSPYTTGALEL